MTIVERKKNLSAGSFPSCLRQPGLGEAEPGARNSGWDRDSGIQAIICVFANMHMSRKLGWKWRLESILGRGSPPLGYGIQASPTGAQHATPQHPPLEFALVLGFRLNF